MTASCGRRSTAAMTLPPPAPARLEIDYRGLRPGAPVSDHSTVSRVPVPGLPAPHRKATNVSLVDALFFAGIDWAAKTHAVCVLDPAGRQVARFTIEHTATGFTGLIRRLAKLGDPAGVPVAIERPDGRLVDALLAAGHPVVPVKPNAIKTWREGEVISGAKSDPGDAHVIAEYLRLRARHLRAASPLSEHTTALRTVSRTRSDLVEARVAATNQLCALLDAHWPGAGEVFADVASPISLAFLTRYPTPAHAAMLGEKRMAAFTTKHGYSGRRSPGELLARLRTAPDGTTSTAVGEALRDAVLAMVAVLTALNTAIRDLDRSAAAHLHEHPDRAVFTSFPRAGLVNAAQIRARRAQRLHRPRGHRRARRARARHPSLGQAPRRELPLGLQQTPARGDHHVRRQLPPRQPLGRRHLPTSPRQREGPPTRRADPCPRLGPHHLALLDRSTTLRPHPTSRRQPAARNTYSSMKMI